MAFLRVDGYAIDVSIADFEGPIDVSVEDYGRSIGSSLDGTTFAIKKAFNLKTHWLSPEDAFALEGWLRSRRHLWSFNYADTATTRFSLVSSDGGLAVTGASITTATNAVWGTWCARLVSTASAVVVTTFGSEADYTISGYVKSSGTTGWSPFATRYKAGVVDAWLGGATVSTLRFMQVTAASGSLNVVLLGRNSAGTNSTTDFSYLAVAPFAYSQGMIQTLSSPTFSFAASGPAAPPYVMITGTMLHGSLQSCNGWGEPGPMKTKATVSTVTQQPVTLDGVFQPSARSLAIRIEEY